MLKIFFWVALQQVPLAHSLMHYVLDTKYLINVSVPIYVVLQLTQQWIPHDSILSILDLALNDVSQFVEPWQLISILLSIE